MSTKQARIAQLARSCPARVLTSLNHHLDEDFRPFSFGFRPGRSAHHALRELPMGVRCWPHPGHRHSSASGCTSTPRLSRCAGRAWAPRTGGRLG
ncbi:MAG TPA: hypothetical protein VK458_04785, partial [Myxococcaceae bacterium]|nr:hypothetical protein [Myxococcaceae bacterium]